MKNFLQSPLLNSIPEIQHGFGTALEPISSLFATHWETHRPKHQQVHGISVARIDHPGQEAGQVDGLYTRSRKIPLGVMTADCVPILLSRRDGTAIAAVHSGWRGTYSRILKSLWNQLSSDGDLPDEWVAAIGPTIGPCCYEVSPELAQNFQTAFEKVLPKSEITPRPRHLDLQAIQAAELKALGITQVEILRYCTLCTIQPTFHSYRREGGGTRQWSIIELR